MDYRKCHGGNPININITKEYLYNLLFLSDLTSTVSGKSQPQITRANLSSYQIPLPPLEIQQKIVDEIDAIESNNLKQRKNITNKKGQIEILINECYKNYSKIKLKKIVITNPSKSEVSDLTLDANISFVDMQSVSNDGYIEKELTRPYSEVKKGSYTYFKRNDVIVAKITPCMENGKCACTNHIMNNIGFGSSEFHVFRPTEEILSKYLFNILNRENIRKDAEKQMTGASGHKRVPISFYENLEIPLPPLNEQQKIVSQIEELEKQIDEAQKLINVSEQQKQSILKKYL